VFVSFIYIQSEPMYASAGVGYCMHIISTLI